MESTRKPAPARRPKEASGQRQPQRPSQRPAAPQAPPPQRPPQRRPVLPQKEQLQSFWQRIYCYIQRHILVRNLIIAFSLGIILAISIALLLNIFTRHGQRHEVPTLIGKNWEEAEKIARETGHLRLEVVDSLYMPKQTPGVVLDQNPKPGMGVKSGRRVFLTINAFRPRMAVIPHVSGLSLRQAKNILENKGFEIAELIYRSDLATNNVLEERYKGQVITGSSELKAELGSAITLIVGFNSSSASPRVPKIIGLTLREAKSRLWEVGLNIGAISRDGSVTDENLDQARIYSQEPNQTQRSGFGSRVALWTTVDSKKILSGSRDSDSAAEQNEEENPDSTSMDQTSEEE